MVAFLASTILSVVALRFLPVYFTPLMFIRCSQQISEGKDLKLSHHWVPLEKISPYLPLAVMGSEDANFLNHHGFDYKAIEHAAKRNREHPEKRKLGASTISQQTAKNVFTLHKRTVWRKAVEGWFTLLIEWIWGKERILEVYLNVAEMGKGIYGAQAAAEAYWSKTASEITRRQACLIAACLPSPLKRSPVKPGEYVSRQANVISARENNISYPDWIYHK